MRYPKDVTAEVAELVALHLRFYGYGRGEWTDSAVRRYVTDAGDLLPRLHKLTRSDCTTRNRRKAAQLAADYDALEERIARIAAEEDLARVRPDLDGNAIMELLGVPPGPMVGRAWRTSRSCAWSAGRWTATRPRRSCCAGPAPRASSIDSAVSALRLATRRARIDRTVEVSRFELIHDVQTSVGMR